MSTHDVFTDEQEDIVDFDVLEAAKENVQPLATGRRVTTLSQILTTPHAQREAKLSATRNRLRINVELAFEDEDGDPLEAYSRLVNWTLENYPQGHTAESGLLELLEEATRVLKDDRGGKWRQEMKYLKLWLLYASYVEKPTVIYRFLIANEIGTNFALLYGELAAVLERDGRKKDADDIYNLGIARKASPLDHLQNRYNEFQKRMLSGAAMPSTVTSSDASSSTSESRSSSRPQRPALTTTRTTLAPSGSSRPSSLTPSVPNSRLQVFVDPSGAEAEAAEAGAWPDLGTRKSRVKENVPEVKRLAGTTIKQSGRSKRVASGSSGNSAGTSGSRIVPYRDPDPVGLPPVIPTSKKTGGFVPFMDGGGAAPTAPSPPATPRFTPFRDDDAQATSSAVADVESVIKVKKAGTKQPMPASETEALRKDPLKNYGSGAFEDG
ncbi:other/BUB protein kinase [Amanita rubescens]|nr:other/BUB protein kinase [Amanita rubescens]